MARATSSLPVPLSPRTRHAAGRAGDAVDFRFEVAHRRAVADQLIVAGRFFHQPLVVAAERRQGSGTHERDGHDVGDGNDEVEIGLAEAAVFEIDVNGAERRSLAIFVAAHERCADGIGKMAQVLRTFLRGLVGNPHGVALPRHQFGERLIQRDAIGCVAGDYEFWLQAAFVVDGKEAHDRCAGSLAQQVERDFHHAVRVAAAQQFDAELVEEHQLFDLLGARQAGQGFFVRFLDRNRKILDDRLLLLGVVALGGWRFFGFVKFEFGRADVDGVAIDDGGFVDFLAVNERAVAAFGVADDPTIGRGGKRGVDARAKRVGQRDVAIGAAANERVAAGIERKIRAGAVAREDRQISV